MKKIQFAFVVAAVAAALVGRAALAGEANTTGQPSTVVFFCEHGSAKSLVAANLFNRMAEQRGLSVRGLSRAVSARTVDSKVPLKLARIMAEDGFEVAAFRPQAVTAAEAANASRVVVIDYDGDVEALGNVPVERWSEVAPVGLDYAGAKRDIAAHVESLLHSIANR
jgi:arsenate reductase